MNPRLVVIGFTNIDVNVTPDGTTTLPGGGAYFAAIAASRILHPVGLVTRIGKEYEADFLLSRVLSDGVHIIQDKPTATSTQVYHSRTDLTDRDISLEWGVAPDVCPEDIPTGWIEHAEYIHIATMPPKQQLVFLKYLRAKNVKAKISFDTDLFFLSDPENVRQIKENYTYVDLVFVNRREYDILKDAVDTVPQAIVKLDKDGAYVLEKGMKTLEVKTTPVDVVDATGAGDVFAGTYLSSMLIQQPQQQALETACAVATMSVQQQGVGHLFPAADRSVQ